jgi:hypothetical protein
MVVGPIKVEGLKELRKRLRKVADASPKGLRLAGNRAAQIVVDTAKPRVPLGPGQGGHAVSSIKVASTQSQVRVSAGGKKYPYYAFLDFGGKVGPRKRTTRPYLRRGRYIWAAFADKQPEIAKALNDELINVARDAGLDVS